MLRDYLRPLTTLIRSTAGTSGVATLLGSMNAKLDHLNALASQPAPAAPVAEPPPPQVVLPPAVFTYDTSLLLHQARSVMLREMPPGAHRLLSAGCAGNWYFDWIAKTYGFVAEHIGIEYYTPPPAVLPDNVTWIANTASDMHDVEDATCDLVFSGQNLEHLWADEVAGFLVESARVLKPGGHIAVDSPNRELTRPLNWSHPEHTIELTVPEIHRLLELAGFDVTKEVGIWLCRDPATGRVIPFDANIVDADWSIVERMMAARLNPEDAFIWWLEGRRNDKLPDRAGIVALLAASYREAWPERVQRLATPPERSVETRADGDWIVLKPGEIGVAFYGPYMPLRAGRHRISFDIVADPGTHGVLAACDVCRGAEGALIISREVTPEMRRVTLEITLPELVFGIQFRCFSVTGGFSVRRHIDLEEYPNDGAGSLNS